MWLYSPTRLSQSAGAPKLPLLSLLLAVLSDTAPAQLTIPKELAGEAVGIEKAGVKARLSPKGIQHIAHFLANALVEEIGSADEFKADPVQVTGTSLTLAFTDVSATNPGSVVHTSLLSSHQLAIDLPGLSISSKAALDGNDPLITADTLVDIQIAKVALRLNLTLVTNHQSSPVMRLDGCHLRTTAQNRPTIHIHPEVDGTLKARIEEALSTTAHILLEQPFCALIGLLLEERVNRRFGLLANKLTLTSTQGDQMVEALRLKSRNSRATLRPSRTPIVGFPPRHTRQTAPKIFQSFDVGRADILLIDYALTAEPRITPLGVELECSSEVSLHGRGGTPFGAAPFRLPETANENSMLQMAISDFVPNSLLYHGHTIGLFNTRVDPATPHFGPIMRTSCGPKSGLLFCMGDFFPTLKKLHPELPLALSFSTMESPVIKFRPPSAGGIKFHLRGKISMSLLPGGNGVNRTMAEREVAVMGIEVTANMRLRLSSMNVKPRVTFDRLKLITLSPGILIQNELDDAVVLAKEVLQRMVNEVLREGIPLPVHPLFKLNKPRVKVMDRALLLQTNLDLNEPLMLRLMSRDLGQN